jgi:hypothetical protein
VDLDVDTLLASFIPSSIGLGVFVYGKRQGRGPHLIIGLLLMVYPYFLSNVWLMLGIGAVLLGALYGAVRFGL